MNRKHNGIVFFVFILCLAFYLLSLPEKHSLNNVVECDRIPVINPDYSDIVIPPNISPLNFLIKENVEKIHVRIHSKSGDAIIISARDSCVKIPLSKWKKLLENNRNESLFIDISVKKRSGSWNRYKTITNKIGSEKIDGYLVYRLINPGYRLWKNMGIYCRNIQNFNEKPIIVNNLANKNCINCHSFGNNNPEKALLHIRGDAGGTILIENGKFKKLNTATDFTISAGVYPAWHPNGKIIAFSVNKISQEFYSAGPASIKVFDSASDLVVYNIIKNTVTTFSKISGKDFENMPVWSPDGKYLYYCSAPQPDSGHTSDSLKYSLFRISFDAGTEKWGDVDTVLSTDETGMSISWPRISPDGKFVMFCMTDYGYFPTYNSGSDIYIMNLHNHEYKILNINSDESESYHSWSSNGRWFVFSSKRMNGLCSRPYFSYFDTSGTAYKPFLMPQKDPLFYDTFLKSYNIPEMITAPWRLSMWELYETIKSNAANIAHDKNDSINALSGATKIK